MAEAVRPGLSTSLPCSAPNNHRMRTTPHTHACPHRHMPEESEGQMSFQNEEHCGPGMTSLPSTVESAWWDKNGVRCRSSPSSPAGGAVAVWKPG